METCIRNLIIVLFIVVAFQSCAAGVVNTIEENGQSSGSAGIIVAVVMLAGGIVSVATRNSERKGGNIAFIILFCPWCIGRVYACRKL